jgi:O-antigen chain-terminating methyltransferase
LDAVSDDRQRSGEEIAEIINQIRERVRARYASLSAPTAGLVLPDLLPLLHARDTAEGKVASIGIVNPRPPGVINNIIQSLKRLVARALDWHVREQVEFNRAVVTCIDAALEALNDTNRSIARLGELYEQSGHQQLDDMRAHWNKWRLEWEDKLTGNEIKMLRSVAELQGAFQHRVTDVERNFHSRVADVERSFRELTRVQHQEFTMAADRALEDARTRLREDFERVRTEYERLIYNELRVVRQRGLALSGRGPAAPPSDGAAEEPQFDYLRFSERFRGSEDHIKQSAGFYIERFLGCSNVLDLGCGRGEFLKAAKAAGIAARGVELSAELAALCSAQGLEVEHADLFPYLESLAPASLGGILCAHVIEHLPPARVPELIRLAAEKLVANGLLMFETPNPECLAIFASHFYIDPTHVRPAPASLMVFYLEEAGFGRIEVHPRSPAVDSMPSLAELPENFRNAFFGGLDYAVMARRL